MNYGDFRSLVSGMRAAQKAYFRERSNDLLRESVAKERAVDKALSEYDEGQQNFLEDTHARNQEASR